ncbi:hypothetical protein K7I13_08610 [Brucepastera parasyntrophica]|uniref:hypothetical protein n=1 Tax=Brucepastera parasyntrophica TaxID=2880008 RepID=UPI00210A2355|nr:hypothetical protein [Brucepastera parasyntrophica]ULQ58623.1 hypothetical protein K7I13_08610 [Brucepastera parasyntrophica]
MKKFDVTIIENQPEKTIYGLWKNSNDKTISKDIPRLSKQYGSIPGRKPGIPFYVLTKITVQKQGILNSLRAEKKITPDWTARFFLKGPMV